MITAIGLVGQRQEHHSISFIANNPFFALQKMRS